MSEKTNPIPEGYKGATPYLCVSGASKAIDFYKQAFGAVETLRIADPSGKIGHAEIKIGEATIMLADEFPEMGFRSPQAFGGSPVTIHLYVADVDTLFSQAVAAGAKAVEPVEDKFYGDRAGKLEDPFGHVWYIATHKEDIAPEEVQKRAAAMYG
ncbi:MAG: VOC family protein [Pyrinomonadaceae bacterium]|jgi:PhnB protein|nr:VOC family protein [Pyrinomonadaceae bacterium]MDQ3585245.1 VOC family protein [Acidobacteriota bacterium]